MDPITIDTLVRTLSVCGTRRQLVTVLAALPLVGLLTGFPADDIAAERPPDRLQRRTTQRNRKQRNQNNTNQSNNGNNKNNNKKNGGDLGDDYPNRCGDMVCPSDKPLCCEIYYDGNLALACLGGTACPPVTT